MHVKELLPHLKCLDNITTESARAQRDVQNEFDFNDEWTYINRVIDEFVSAPYKVVGKLSLTICINWSYPFNNITHRVSRMMLRRHQRLVRKNIREKVICIQ